MSETNGGLPVERRVGRLPPGEEEAMQELQNVHAACRASGCCHMASQVERIEELATAKDAFSRDASE